MPERSVAVLDTTVAAARVSRTRGCALRAYEDPTGEDVDLDSNVFDSGGDQRTAYLTASITEYATAHSVDLSIDHRSDDKRTLVIPGRDRCHCARIGSEHILRWLEACCDLGNAVIAPDCGYFAQQSHVEHTLSIWADSIPPA